MKSLLSLLTVFLMTTLLPLGSVTASQTATIEAEQLLQSPEKYLIVDVRTPEEYQQGHIPGAVLMPLDTLLTQTNSDSRFQDKPAVVYCRSGRRAGVAIEQLKNLGVKQLSLLNGHMIEWMANDRPTHSGIMP